MSETLDWNKWCELFQDIDYFSPLIRRIFTEKKLGDVRQIENVTPGTNAVFKVNDFIVKLFVPDEVKPWKQDDFNNERQGIARAMELGVSTPALVTSGTINDRYVWNYMVFEYIKASEVGTVRSKFNYEEKIQFSKNMRYIVERLNVQPEHCYSNAFIKDRVINGERWNHAKRQVKEELKRELEKIDLSNSVHVHGDLTAENVMIDEQGTVSIIDFADRTIAPRYYEYPPILFDLFDCDGVMMNQFFRGDNREQVIDEVYKGLLLHDFGGDFANLLLKQFKNKTLSELDSIHELKMLIHKIII